MSVSDENGNILQRYRYSAFGEQQVLDANFNPVADTPLIPFAYTGREWEPEIGMYFYRARFYDPVMGRFISRDPLGHDGGDVNLYAYVGNNPFSYWDPTGQRSRWSRAWDTFNETTSGELGVGLGLSLKGKLGPVRAQGGADISMSAAMNLDSDFTGTFRGDVGVRAGLGKHSIGANYGGEVYVGGEDIGGSRSNSVFGYDNESSGGNTSNTSVGIASTIGLVRLGFSIDPFAVIRELFRDCD